MSGLSFPKEITLHIDLGAAAVALVALIFSIWSFYNQRRISIEALRIQRDNDIIGWTNFVIDTLVGIECLLRDPTRYGGPTLFAEKRDEFLAKLSAEIDKGRPYFPNFVLDVVGPATAKPPSEKRAAILDRLVEMYDLVKGVNPTDMAPIQSARAELLLRKRAFMTHARSEVDPQRRLQFLTQ